ncbi:hypothetical protein ACEQ8H_002026 [Pleosporales sp. CAS-2024a]
MANPPSSPQFDWKMYRYVPTLVGAMTCVVVFLLLALLHMWQFVRLRQRMVVLVVIGAFCEVAGYGARIGSHFDNQAWGSFIAQSVFLLVGPLFFAATIYMMLGRTIRLARGEDVSWIKPKWYTSIFVTADVTTLIIQGLGSSIMGTMQLKLAIAGEKIVIAGLALQVATFVVFLIASIDFHIRMNRIRMTRMAKGTTGTDTNWKKMLWILYTVSLLVLFRCVFRLIEYAMGNAAYPISHEWTLYCFDSVPMFLVLLLLLVLQPTNYVSEQEEEELAESNINTWQAFAARGDDKTQAIHREWVPQMSVSHPYLLYAVLSITASHYDALQPSKRVQDKALVYRQKTFEAYTQALQNMTSDNYETIVLTATLMLALHSPPAASAADQDHVEWMHSLLKLSEGLRILVSLRWAQGIEHMSVYPVVRRELRTLPPPPPPLPPPTGASQQPVVVVEPRAAPPLGTTPDHPNPASTYPHPHAQTRPNTLFLPPPLRSLLDADADATLLPVLHALSRVILSLYYYHLNPDFYVRIMAFSSFLMPDFVALVQAQEPSALLLLMCFFALADCVPHPWWDGSRVGAISGALGRAIRVRESSGDGSVLEALAWVERIVRVNASEGAERAAESVFDDWEGVNWAEGPIKAQEWEQQLTG